MTSPSDTKQHTTMNNKIVSEDEDNEIMLKLMMNETHSNVDEDDATTRRRTTKVAAMAWFGGTVGVICGLTAPFIFTKTVLPYMATPKTKVEYALRFCLQQQQQQQKKTASNTTTTTTTTSSSKKNTNINLRMQRTATRKQQQQQIHRLVFVDLGSGDGEAVKQAAKLGYDAVGLELNATMWLVSSIRRLLFFTKEERTRSTFVYGNMFDHSLGESHGSGGGHHGHRRNVDFVRWWNADVVMIFGVTPLMASISRKIQDECKPGTYILAYRFGLPLFHPSITDSTDQLNGRVIYDREEMRIYEKLS
jgi:hypothetical protein